jgi:hypothetical protein
MGDLKLFDRSCYEFDCDKLRSFPRLLLWDQFPDPC